MNDWYPHIAQKLWFLNVVDNNSVMICLKFYVLLNIIIMSVFKMS